jgi:hypothetical protein
MEWTAVFLNADNRREGLKNACLIRDEKAGRGWCCAGMRRFLPGPLGDELDSWRAQPAARCQLLGTVSIVK